MAVNEPDLLDGVGRELPGSASPSPAPLAPELAHVPTERSARHTDRLRRDAVFRRLLAAADLCAAAGTMAIVGALARGDLRLLAIVTALGIVPLAKLMGRYDREASVLRKSTLEEFPSLVILTGAFALMWSLLLTAFGPGHVHESAAGLVWLYASALIVFGRWLARSLARAASPIERVLILGGRRARTRLAHSLESDPTARLRVVGFLPLEDDSEGERDGIWTHPAQDATGRASFADFDDVVRRLSIDRVVLIPASTDNTLMLAAVSRANRLDVQVSIVPSLLEVVGSAVEFDAVGGVTMLGLRQPGLNRSSRAIKRLVDLVGAAGGLLLLSPVMLIAAIAVTLDSRGPVFFRQQRVGRAGRPFSMIKFRSMVDGAEAQQAALQALNETEGLFKLRVDPRVTRTGRVLRAISIDELPQLFNVLRGDMSLVGPRPLVLEEDRLIEGHHRSRLSLAPGMTGPWQVLGPARPPLSEMAKTDYLYAANWTLWTDVKILVRTFAHVSSRRGI